MGEEESCILDKRFVVGSFNPSNQLLPSESKIST